MKFNELMHSSTFVKDMDVIRDFYENKLGLKPVILTKYKSYINRKDSPYYEPAISNPDGICIIYYKISNNQFLEFIKYPKKQKQKEGWKEYYGNSHIGLTVDDIFEAKKELEEKGIVIDTEPKKGNSNTWQMWIHDPEGNAIEIMQFTKDSYQIVGHIDE